MIKIGDLVETCSLMPGVVMKITGDDIEVRMLNEDDYNGQDYACCSLRHCGIVKITAQQALNRLKLGKKRLSALYTWSDTLSSSVDEDSHYKNYLSLVDDKEI